MTDPTPMGMLKAYRDVADQVPFNGEQLKLFRSMAPRDQIELLFHMHIHGGRLMQMLHSRLDADEARTHGMEATQRAPN